MDEMKELTKIEKGLLYGLKVHFKMPKEESAAILTYLEEDDKLLMFHWLVHNLDATHQEIMNEFGRLLKQRAKLNESMDNTI